MILTAHFGPQRFALHIFHHHESAAFVLADFVHGDDVWMVQSGGSFGFATEPLVEFSIGCMVRRQEFERDFVVYPVR